MKYSKYISLQKEKTCDPNRRHKWLTKEWDLKLNGFKRIFNEKFAYLGADCLCTGARTGQEVQALKDIGKNAIGIDIVACDPLVEEGDFHSLRFDDNSFDFVFSNVVDHALYPDKFFSEAIRVTRKGGHLLFHLQVNKPNDKYGVHDINDLNKDVLQYTQGTEVVAYDDIYHKEFCTFNKEILLKKI